MGDFMASVPGDDGRGVMASTMLPAAERESKRALFERAIGLSRSMELGTSRMTAG